MESASLIEGAYTGQAPSFFASFFEEQSNVQNKTFIFIKKDNRNFNSNKYTLNGYVQLTPIALTV